MRVARFRMRAFKIHHFLIGHNAPCPKIKCIIVYVKKNQPHRTQRLYPRNYYSDFNAMKGGLDRVNRQPSNGLKNVTVNRLACSQTLYFLFKIRQARDEI